MTRFCQMIKKGCRSSPFWLLGKKVTNPLSCSFLGYGLCVHTSESWQVESWLIVCSVCIYKFCFFYTEIAYRAVHFISSRNRNHDRPIRKHMRGGIYFTTMALTSALFQMSSEPYAFWWIGRESNPRLACFYVASFLTVFTAIKYLLYTYLPKSQMN